MSELLNPRHEAFCQAYVRGPHAGNYTAAYAAAGFAPDDSNSSRLARDPRVRKRIGELIAQHNGIEQEAIERATVALTFDKISVLGELQKIAFSNMFDCVHVDDHDTAQVDIASLERDHGAALKHMSVDYETAPDGRRVVKRVRMSLFEKRIALMDLGRHLGLFAKPAAGRGGTAQAPDTRWRDPSQVTDGEVDDALVSMLANACGGGIDLADLTARAEALARQRYGADVVARARRAAAAAGEEDRADEDGGADARDAGGSASESDADATRAAAGAAAITPRADAEAAPWLARIDEAAIDTARAAPANTS